MPRRLLFALLALAATIVLLGPAGAAAADDAEPAVSLPERAYALDAGVPGVTGAQPAQPYTAASCNDLVSAERQLEREERDLEPKGSRGNPLLCLMYYPTDDIYWAVIIRFDGTDHFRAAKESAIRRLEDSGFDLCSIGTWGAYGRIPQGEQLWTDDYMNLPVECAPRVVAADPGAEARLDAVRDALGRGLDVTDEQMGWRPNRPLTVIVMTDVNVAVRTYQRHLRGSSMAAQIARDGRSSSVRVSVFGGLILANLTKSSSTAAIDAFLMHEYTHFAQGGISGSNDFLPKWFIEGQAVYQESRNTKSSTGDYLNRVATRAQREGSALRLSEISTPDDWNAQERRGVAGSDAAYSRGYAAVSFLVKRHGFESTVELMRDNHNGSLERFNELLAGLSGMDLDALDEGVGTWLVTGEIPVAAQPPVTTTPPATGTQPPANTTQPPVTSTQPPASTTQPPVTGTQPPTTAQPPATPTGGTQPPAAGTPGPVSMRFVAVDSGGSFRIDLTTNASGTGAQGTLKFDRPITCAGGRSIMVSQSTFTLTIQPNGSFTVSITGGTALITLDGRFSGGSELRGTLRLVYTDGGCDTGLLAFVGKQS